jgi:hypothetical protein
MHPGRPFYYRMFLKAEADLNSSWTRPLAFGLDALAGLLRSGQQGGCPRAFTVCSPSS